MQHNGVLVHDVQDGTVDDVLAAGLRAGRHGRWEHEAGTAQQAGAVELLGDAAAALQLLRGPGTDSRWVTGGSTTGGGVIKRVASRGDGPYNQEVGKPLVAPLDGGRQGQEHSP